MKTLLLIIGAIVLIIIVLFLYCSVVLAKECDMYSDSYKYKKIIK